MGINKIFSYYLPANVTDFIADLMEVLVEAEVFVEVAFGKILDVLPLDNKYSFHKDHIHLFRHNVFKYLWYDGSRERVLAIYNDTQLGLHPLKMSGLHTSLTARSAYVPFFLMMKVVSRFCSTIVQSFGKHIYY